MKKPPPPIVWPWTPQPEPIPAGESLSDTISRQMGTIWLPEVQKAAFDLNAFFRPKAKLKRTRRGFMVVAGKLPRFNGGKRIKVPLTYGGFTGGGSWHSKP